MSRTAYILLWILADAVIIVVIAMIEFYLRQDRRRFRVERLFKTVRPLLDEWMKLAGRLPDCGHQAGEYARTRDVCKKLGFVGELADKTRGQQTERMAQIARKLSPFYADYEKAAREHNRRFNDRLPGRVLRLLGFREIPEFRLAKHIERDFAIDPDDAEQ